MDIGIVLLMNVTSLILYRQISEASKCGIYNTLLKYRPDLGDEIESVPGRDIDQSVDFLKRNNLWDRDAEKYLKTFRLWLNIFHDGPDEWSAEKVKQAQNQLMCYIANLIRRSAVKENVDPASQFAQQLMNRYGDLGLRNLRMNMDRRHSEPVVELSDIWVDKDVQGKGIGSRVMHDITEWADRIGATIWLQLGEREQGRGTTSTGRLQKFYRRFGFKPNRGRNKRYDLSMYAQMYREPS